MLSREYESGAVRDTAAVQAYVPALAMLGAAGVLLTLLARDAWLVLLTDGLLTVAVLAAAVGWGAWPTVWLGLGRRPVLQQFCLASALGLGLLGLLTLGLGVAGLLTRVVAYAVVALGWGLAIARAYILQRSAAEFSARSPTDARSVSADTTRRVQIPRAGAWGSDWLGTLARTAVVLTLAVPIAVALFGACLPPGLLWNGEARGYDALEYHLQAPREYFDAGRITFLPHNVYASFPQQMEMLYLLLMHMAGGSLAAAIPAQLLHAACGVLTVLTLAAWTRPGWPRCLVAVAAGTIPWLAYIACLAYVELGMLFFAAVAAGLILDHFHADVATGLCTGRDGSAVTRGDWRLTFAAGLCAGFSGGCKYQALALMAAAVGVAWLGTMRASTTERVKRMTIFGVGVLATFSPWLIRDIAFTGNPVYPFAYRWFDGAAWSTEQARQWGRGHALPPENATVGGRARIVADELFTSRMFGPVLFVLGLGGLILARSRAAAMLAIWFTLIVAGWALFTHMPGRFVLPAIVPLVMLYGCGLVKIPVAGAPGSDMQHLPARWSRATTAVFACVVIGGAIANNITLAGVLYGHTQWWTAGGVPLRGLVGTTEGLAAAQPLKDVVSATGKTWLVGDARAFYLPSSVHYTVVFSRDPWLEYARHATPAECVAWLAAQNVARVVFSWDEIARLQGSYGFSAVVTPEWVQALVAAGLRHVDLPPDARLTGIEVYEVPSE